MHEAGRGGEDVGSDEEFNFKVSFGVRVPVMTRIIIIVVSIANDFRRG